MAKPKAVSKKVAKRPIAKSVPINVDPTAFNLILKNTEKELRSAPPEYLQAVHDCFASLLSRLQTLSASYGIPVDFDYRIRLVVKPEK